MEALTGSKGVATLLTWLVFVLFCALIATGWWYLLAPTLGHRVVAGVGAVALTAVAAMMARQIAHFRAEAVLHGEQRRWYRGFVPYLFLFVISAVGTLNAAFVLFESRTILRSDIAYVRSNYSNLRDTAHKNLPPQDYMNKAAEVNGLLKSLHEEIANPVGGNYCGVGVEALKIIEKIRILIPDYHLLNGSGPIKPCDYSKAERLYQSYQAMALEMLGADHDFLKANGPAKLSFLHSLDQNYRRTNDQLSALEASASGLGGTDSLNKQALSDARNSYNADLRTYISLSGDVRTQLREISSLQSDEVSSYAATLDLFLRRLLHRFTAVYLILAIMLDIATIYLLTQLSIKYGKPRKAVPEPEEAKRFQTDPRFLWTNPVTEGVRT